MESNPAVQPGAIRIPAATTASPLREPAAAVEVPVGWTALTSRLVGLLFLFVTVQALFSVPRMMWELAVGDPEWAGIAFALAVATGTAVALWLGRHRAAAWTAAAARRLCAVPRLRWLSMVILGGLALRLAWALLFPAPFASDGLSYYELGERLANGLTYQAPPRGEWAWWPPGYPFLLFAGFEIFGVAPWVVTLVNSLLFVATIPVLDALAARLGGEETARVATLLFALWPNLVTMAGVASKEMVIVLLLPSALLLYLAAGSSRSRAARSGGRIAAGLALGYATLTQPGVMLVVLAFPIWDVLLRVPLLRVAVRFATVLLGMALIVLPWTTRNHRVLGEFVLVSTNGGGVFYRANNPLANGGFMERGERQVKHLDELTQNRLGYQWGKEWIREHPADFLKLAVRKQTLFLGDDGVGLYEIKRSESIGDAPYAGAKLAVNAWWWGIWALVLLALLTHPDWTRRPEVLLVLLAILYFWAIHSVFESGGRHHVPLAALLAVLGGWVGTRNSTRAADTA
ncbi:MAG TPA: glycosyltransferase family 39 protein [Thermoanaerobaculia bacterium]|nr:glycosyltransferase family 39 protein [Thermoanaerobaculia bacterium]